MRKEREKALGRFAAALQALAGIKALRLMQKNRAGQGKAHSAAPEKPSPHAEPEAAREVMEETPKEGCSSTASHREGTSAPACAGISGEAGANAAPLK